MTTQPSSNLHSFGTLLLALSNRFILLSSDRMDEIVQESLDQVVAFCEAERGWVIDFHDSKHSGRSTFEYRAFSLYSGGPELGGLLYQKLFRCGDSWILQKIRTGEIVYIPELPKEAPAATRDLEILKTFGVQSLLAIPLIAEGVTCGVLGLESIHHQRAWPPDAITMFRVVGQMFGSVLQRRYWEAHEQELRNRFVRVVESISEGIVISDLSEKVLYMNEPMARMTGFSIEELSGASVLQNLLPENEWNRVEEGTQRRLSGHSDTYDVQMRRKDGSIFWAEVHACPYCDQNGKVIGSLALISDISVRKEAEIEREHLQRQFLQAQKMEAVGQLAAGVAHDLNNTLGAISGHLQLIRSTIEPQSKVDRSIEVALTGCTRASELVNTLVTFSKQGEWTRESSSVGAIVRETVDFIGKIVHRGVQIDIDEGSLKNLYALMDRSQFQQVLTNLFINAAQAMPEGGTISLEGESVCVLHPERYNQSAQAGEFVVVRVMDSGSGIAPDDREKIFEPFFTTKLESGGTGLGLAMVHGAMQRHGGWVVVESEVGKGSVFSLYLPRVEMGKEQGEMGQVFGDEQTDPNIFGKVLVIDDEPLLVDLMSEFLELSQFEAVGFTRSTEALEWYQANASSVDLIVLDMKMPELSGVKCFEEMRLVNPKAQIILLSGYANDADTQALLERGALAFFQKPINYPRLISWISDCLKKNRDTVRRDSARAVNKLAFND